MHSQGSSICNYYYDEAQVRLDPHDLCIAGINVRTYTNDTMSRQMSHLFRSFALAALCAGAMSAATISLDDAGTDPILTTPFFVFATDDVGHFADQFTNESGMDFTFLQLTATFSQAFWLSASGPPNVGAFCDGSDIFNSCNISVQASTFTLVFTFSGLDATHHGIPLHEILGVTATNFQPEQVIVGQAVDSMPEPASVGLAGVAMLLLIVGARRRHLLKLRVRT
jgi:hypothetical protein